MKGILRTALIVGGLIFVGMLGLKTMSMVWTDSTSHAKQGHWTVDDFGREHFVPAVSPGVAVGVLPGPPAIADDVWPVDTARVENVDIAYPMTGYAVVNTNSHFLGMPRVFIALFFAVVALIVLVGAFVILLRLTRAKRAALPEDIELVHELSRRAQDLAQRMEALETILLDRTRATR